MRTHNTLAIAAAAFGLMLAASSSAQAGQILEITGNSVLVPPGGYVYCKVTVSSRREANLAVTLLDANGASVPADFGTTVRVSPDASDDGRYQVETTVGAFGDPAQSAQSSCRASVEGRFGRDVQAQIEVTAYDAAGDPVAQ